MVGNYLKKFLNILPGDNLLPVDGDVAAGGFCSSGGATGIGGLIGFAVTETGGRRASTLLSRAIESLPLAMLGPSLPPPMTGLPWDATMSEGRI